MNIKQTLMEQATKKRVLKFGLEKHFCFSSFYKVCCILFILVSLTSCLKKSMKTPGLEQKIEEISAKVAEANSRFNWSTNQKDPFGLWVLLGDNQSASATSPSVLSYIQAKFFPTLHRANMPSEFLFGSTSPAEKKLAHDFDKATVGVSSHPDQG